jgi:hypothetical protein
MIVSRTNSWTVLRTVPANFQMIGDLNARYVQARITAPDSECVPQVISPPHKECATAPDCSPDNPVRTV